MYFKSGIQDRTLFRRMRFKKLVRITTVPSSLNKLLEGQLNFMNKYYDVIAVSSNRENLEKIGKKEGVKTFSVEMTREITPVQDLIALFKLYKFLKREKPFIVHTHTPKAGIIGMLAAKLTNIPVRLHTVAGLPLLETKGIKRKILNFVEKFTYLCATRVYPNSHGLMTIILKEKFTKKSKLKVLGNGSSNGIDLGYFSLNNISEKTKNLFKEKYSITKDDFVFIFVGRIVKDKGINELVEAFCKLNRTFTNIKLLLVGSLEEDLDPISLASKKIIKNNKNIIMTGYQNDVRPFFAISNTLVFPSYREGFPNVVMQAGAMSLPSIVTNINGCNEIIEQDVNGSIIKVKNVEDLYSNMKKFYKDKSYIEKLKTNIREIIVTRYDRQNMFQELLNEYKYLENV